jgi:hypothetical protein
MESIFGMDFRAFFTEPYQEEDVNTIINAIKMELMR